MMKTENEILTIVNEKKLARANVKLRYKNYLSKRLEDLFTKDLNVLVKPIVQTSSKRPPVA